MAKIVRVQSWGGPESLGIDEVEDAPPKRNEVRVRAATIGLNRIDAVYRAGYFGAPPLPARIGYEAAGVVDAIGPGVTTLARGDRVVTIPGLAMEEYGVYGETFPYPANMLIKLAPDADLEAAGAAWMAFFTAYALAEDHPIKPGQHVAINAASSSVGLAAIQVARAEGAIPIAVTRTRAKADALIQRGAAHVIVSNEQDIGETLLALTDGIGAAWAFDAVAGATIGNLTRGMAQNGTMIVYGALAGDEITAPAHMFMMKGLVLRGYSANQVTLDPERLRRAIAYIEPRLADGRFSPVIDARFPLARIADAHRRLESNDQLGKIIVTVP